MSTSRIQNELTPKDQSNDIIQHPDVPTALSCVQSKDARKIWATNPNDPYLYVSFSMEQFISTYGFHDLVQNDITRYKLENVKRQREGDYKKIITKEWIKRARLPIKFLPKDATPESIQDKNVCFIFNRGETSKTDYGITFSYSSRFKAVAIVSDQNKELSNRDIYAFLHETAHALLSEKHFKPYGNNDEAPYCQLDCKDSVMAYFDDCQDVKQAYTTLSIVKFAAEGAGLSPQGILQGSNPISNKISDEVVDQEVWNRATQSNLPDQLGTYDLLAAKAFNQDWIARNNESSESEREKERKKLENELKKLKKELKKLEPECKISEVQHLRDRQAEGTIETTETTSGAVNTIKNVVLQPYDWLNRKFDNLLQYTLDSTAEMVKECPSYFPPHDIASIRNQHKFNPSNHNASLFYQPGTNKCPVGLLPPGATPLALGKS